MGGLTVFKNLPNQKVTTVREGERLREEEETESYGVVYLGDVHHRV